MSEFEDESCSIVVDGSGQCIVSSAPQSEWMEFSHEPTLDELREEAALLAQIIEDLVQVDYTGNGCAAGLSYLFKGESSNPSLRDPATRHVHGADIMLAMGRLADEVLAPGEEITGIARLNWSAVTYNEIELQAWIGGNKPDELKRQQRGSELQVKGDFTTSDGRKLKVRGYNTEVPCRTVIDYDSPGLGMINSYLGLTRLSGDDDRSHAFHISANIGSLLVLQHSSSSGIVPSFLLETANSAGGHLLRMRAVGTDNPRRGTAYVGRVKDFQLPDRATLAKLNGIVSVRLLDEERIRTKDERFELIPGQFSLRQEQHVIGGGEVHMAYPTRPSKQISE